jgi:acyl-CoA reductase-like NAD-dependent aldehyde dehydrogenase
MSDNQKILACFNPGTGKQFDQVPMATADDVALAAHEMREAASIWGQKPLKERIRILRKLQAHIIDKTDVITETINLDTGKCRQDALIEIIMTTDRLHQYYKNAPRWLARRRVPPGIYIFRRFYTEPQPFGVVAIISPWNYPFDLTMSPVCSALLAGNTVLVKPSEVTGATGVLIERLFNDIPELSPFVRVLHGDGLVGEMVVKSKPDLVFLTGSITTGLEVSKVAAENLTPCLFELGGKDPMIVLEDAAIRDAAKWGVWSACYNAGQTCVAIERVYVVEAVYDEFLREVTEQARKLSLGYSPEIDNPYHLAPLTFTRQKEIIEDHLADALDKGARILVGGESDGLFMRPTIVVDVDHSMKLMREETFGPVMPIMKVKNEEEAIRMANDSNFGLSASIWSRDLQRAQKAGGRLEVGTVNINDASTHYPVSLLPFGGIKQSGSARTHGKSEVLQFTQLHSYSVGRPPLAIDVSTQMRYPGQYRLGKAILGLAFGVTPQQRVQPVIDGVERLLEKKRKQTTAIAAGIGFATAATALLLSLRRTRK